MNSGIDEIPKKPSDAIFEDAGLESDLMRSLVTILSQELSSASCHQIFGDSLCPLLANLLGFGGGLG